MVPFTSTDAATATPTAQPATGGAGAGAPERGPRLAREARTFGGAFVTYLKSSIRAYTLTGWTATTALGSVFLVATAWAISRLVAGGGTPAFFQELTGYSSYVSFAILGFAFNGLAIAALEEGGNAIYQEESWGTWELLALTPFNRFTWLLAKTLAGLTEALIDLVVVIAVGALVFRLTITGETLGVAAVGVLGTILGLAGFAFLMAAVGVVWKQPHAMAVILTPLVIFVSGMMFPVEALPAWVLPVSYAFPLTHGLNVVRGALLLGQGFAGVATPLAWLAATGAAHAVVGFTAFRVMEKRARRLGAMGKY